MNYSEQLDFALELAEEAGKIMRKYFQQEPDHKIKEDETIVTIADEEINQMVIDRVHEKYPEHSVDGEENSVDKGSNHVWVCDPIDGTNPFAMGLAYSVFSIAYVVDGVPLVGVVYEPFTGMMYRAVKGEGAFLNDNPISVNKNGFKLRERVNCDGWTNADYDTIDPVHRMSKEKHFYMIIIGSTTHAATLVARGELIASVFAGTKGKNVDIAAVKVIVEEAGGKVTDLFGREQRYDRPINGALLTNGLVHDDFVEAFKENLEDKQIGTAL